MEHVDNGFRLLGPLAVRRGGNVVSPGRGKSALLLAVLLLANGRSVTTENLMADVWDDRRPSKSTFHGTVNEVRDLLERHGFGPRKQVLRHEASSYRLVVPDEAVDWRLFQRRVAQAREARRHGHLEQAYTALTEALELWHGDPLSGLESQRLENYRTTMLEEHHQVVLRRAELGLELGREAELLADLFTLTRQYPEDQEATRHLMLALHRRGRTTEALAAWRTLHRRIDAREGISLSPTTNELYRRILQEDPSLRSGSAEASPWGDSVVRAAAATDEPLMTPGSQQEATYSKTPDSNPERTSSMSTTSVTRHNVSLGKLDMATLPTAPLPASEIPMPPVTLPRDIRDFIGRTQELRHVYRMVEDRNSDRVWVISGMPGVGKTAFATRIAHKLRRRFLDATLYVRLNGHGPAEDTRNPSEVLYELLRELKVPANNIPDSLESRSTFWRRYTSHKSMILFLDDAASTEQVRPLLPDSQNCLVLITSRVRLSGIDGAHHLKLDPLLHAEAVKLFTKRAGLNHTDDSRNPLDTLACRTGRLPLALHVLAARLREHPSWTVTDLFSTLRDTDDLVGEIRSGDADISLFFAAAAEGLRPDEYRAFLLLGLHSGSNFGLPAAEALLDLPRPQAERMVDTLLRRSLLEEPENKIFRFHDLLGEYAYCEAERKISWNERREAIRRLLDQYLARAEAADRCLHPWRRRISLELSYNTTAPKIRSQVTARNLLLDEQERMIHVAKVSRRHGYIRYEAQLAHILSDFYDAESNWRNGSRLHMRAVEVWNEEENKYNRALALVELSRVWRQRGLLNAAWQTALSALEISKNINDIAGTADALNQLGWIHYVQAEYRQALYCHKRAHVLYREINDRNGMAVALVNCCASEIRLGMHKESLSDSNEAYAIFQRIGNRLGEASALNTKAIVLQLSQRNVDAQRILKDIFDILTGLNRKRELSYILNNLGRVALELSDPQHAAKILESSLQLIDETNELNLRALARCNLAEAKICLGDTHEALRIHQYSLNLIDRGAIPDTKNSRMLILRGIGDVYRKFGEHNISLEYYQDALQLAKYQDSSEELAKSLELIGDAISLVSGPNAARAYWERSLSIYAQLSHPTAATATSRIRTKCRQVA